MNPRKILLRETGGLVEASWQDEQTGMYPIGRGATVLEAVGMLVVYDCVVELPVSRLIEHRFSTLEPSAPRR